MYSHSYFSKLVYINFYIHHYSLLLKVTSRKFMISGVHVDRSLWKLLQSQERECVAVFHISKISCPTVPYSKPYPIFYTQTYFMNKQTEGEKTMNQESLNSNRTLCSTLYILRPINTSTPLATTL